MLVDVVRYDKRWPELYQKEEALLVKALAKELIRCFHIGSTSVIGLKAKPIIDILLVVQDVAKLDAIAPVFEALGYEVMGEFGIDKRRYYRKGGAKRTHHIHAFSFDNISEIIRHLAFRDYLREHANGREQYGSLKAQLAEEFPEDIEQYGSGKNDLVKEIEKKALLAYWQKY